MHSDPVVHLGSGSVRGVREEFGERYRAIPYAAPMRGAARFRAPTVHPGWSGVRDGTRPSPTAPQPGRDFGRLDLSPYFGPGWVAGEEYLTVDVRTPATDGGARPVMVFVHGGGLITGSTRAALYDGGAFARDGVVFVAVNYRLGIPGFLELEDAPANRGLLDVVLALAWVRDNIAAFGGDPGRVTVFGQSAGAKLIAALLSVPEAEGLFRRAIVQSGGGTGAFAAEQAQRVTRAAAGALGIAPTAEAFAGIPDERLLETFPILSTVDLRTDTAFDPLVGLSPFSLVLPLGELTASHAGNVGLLIGTNTEEGNLYLVPQGKFESSTAADVHAVAAATRGDPDAAIAEHLARRPAATPGELRSGLLADALFGLGSARLTAAHARLAPGRTHAYSFGYRSTALDGRLGAAHTVELPFVFDIADEPWLHGDTGLLGPDPAPPGLASRMHAAWVSFAANGDPGWAAYTEQDPVVEVFGVTR
ncbi:para-nitrobenzyl esterase [Crossiella equi]|uniref:Carboxylic ester hydrolase n=1 Tax=Crossiella equi TaxID=130796 RepID=A0ABS5A7Q9_9PSEU|nr:carboxylesterase family protein [Crossiella equi]MBP2472341.1 para-nitrobenzyl esterase [Crossiella equi]